jgi:predicted aspartyl protease
MNQQKDNSMGRVTVEFTVANYHDVLQAEAGALASEKVRRVALKGVVDTGSTRLVLPDTVVAKLGLPSAGQTKVRYAAQRGATRPLVRSAWVELQGRAADFDAIVEPSRTDALLGAIVLEALDFVVDCTTQTLHPRDPDGIVSEIE